MTIVSSVASEVTTEEAQRTELSKTPPPQLMKIILYD